MPQARLLLFLLLSLSCFAVRGSSGGGQTSPEGPRRTSPGDVALEGGYTIEVVAAGLTFPTGVAFDANGTPHVTESGYSYGEVFTTPRLLAIEADGKLRAVASGQDNGPWNGVFFHDGDFYVSEGGVKHGGRILKIDRAGKQTVLVQDLPSYGDHHTNGPVVREGHVYFGQGVATNAAIVGEDNKDFGWLARKPDFHDVPCADITLRGENLRGADGRETGAYQPYGTPSAPNQVIKGNVRCNGAVLRVPIAGGEPEVHAWGFRNPFGLAFTADGRLLVTDNGYDERGRRPIFGSADVLWDVKPGAWHGWPDFAEGMPVWGPFHSEHVDPKPKQLLATHPGQPPAPLARLAVHSSSNGLDVSRSERFGYVGQAFIAQFGDQAPAVGKTMAPVGFKVVRVDLATGEIVDFAVNRGKENGPASKLEHGGFERPTAVRFDPSGAWLYVVDFGVLTMDDKGRSHPRQNTGVLWRVGRQGAR